MSIKTNYPTISPTLSLDFANTRQLDPRITFTRASTATYYDTSTTALAEQNLLLQSQTFGTTWVTTNGALTTGVTDPLGGTTATLLTATSAAATVYQTLTLTATAYTLSLYIQRVLGTGAVNLTMDGTTLTPQTITGSWARYNITVTPTAGAKTIGIQLATITDSVNIWGAQLENRSAVTAYNATTTAAITNYIPVLQTAASGVARFDCNPTTRESLGLLIEEQRTNLFTYSDQFDNAAWSKQSTTVTANSVIAPDGTIAADKIVETAVTAPHSVYKSISVTSGTAYTLTVYGKMAERRYLSLALNNFSAGATFDLQIGTVVGTPISSGGATYSIANVGNGWYRCTVSNTSATTNSFNQFIGIGLTGTLNSNINANESYAGDGISGIYLWGAQLEAGAFATSYIPTVASQVTRSADAASMTGTNFSSWYNQSEGTVYTEINPKALASSNGVILNDNSTNNRIRVATTSLTEQSLITTAGTAQATLDGGTPVANTSMKLATVYKVNDFALFLGGGSLATASSGNVPLVSQLQIGAETTTIGNLTLKKVAYYPLRVTNAQLQGLTTV